MTFNKFIGPFAIGYGLCFLFGDVADRWPLALILIFAGLLNVGYPLKYAKKGRWDAS